VAIDYTQYGLMSDQYRSHATTDDAEKPFKILPGHKHYGQQYDTIYSARLNQLRPALLENAKQAWRKLGGTSSYIAPHGGD
jgi:hypothetical protein